MTGFAYKRTQPGTAMIVAVLIGLCIEALVSFGRPLELGTWVVAFLLFVVGVVFGTMTIAISEDHVEWWFTFGLIRQKIALNQIEFAVSKKVTLLNGLGIRTDGRNWLWIVNGSDVVSLELRDGRKISLGSPEANDLSLLIDRLLSDRI